jgi:uncharacterized protein (DUF58 family)
VISPLAPTRVEGRCIRKGWLPFGAGPRLLWAFAMGLVWLIPAWVVPGLWVAMFIWDAAILFLWAVDLFLLPRPGDLEATRSWSGPLLLTRTGSVTLEVRLARRREIRISAVDEAARSLGAGVPLRQGLAEVGRPAVMEYAIQPRERGAARMGKVYLRYRSFWGLAERWAVADLSQTVNVFPDLTSAREQAVYLTRSRHSEMGQRTRRQRGLGREFESLREYRAGDEYRDVCWSATAKRDQVITRTWEAERSQSIWILLDCGRLLGARVETQGREFTLSKLDYAVDAAMALAEVASLSGDRTGLVSYGRAVQGAVPCGRGGGHLGDFAEALAHARTELREANHWNAAKVLLQKQQRRCLIVWITDFAESAALPEIVECAMHLTRRHLVLVAAIGQPDLVEMARRIPATEGEMFRHAAAQEIVQRREGLLGTLRMSGVLALELEPERLTVSVVNEYLEVKERNRI